RGKQPLAAGLAQDASTPESDHVKHLDRNENPLHSSPRTAEAIRRACSLLNRYPLTSMPSQSVLKIGFSGTMNLSLSGLPPQTTSSFNSSSVVGSGGSTLKVKANKPARIGTYRLTIKRTCGSVV